MSSDKNLMTRYGLITAVFVAVVAIVILIYFSSNRDEPTSTVNNFPTSPAPISPTATLSALDSPVSSVPTPTSVLLLNDNGEPIIPSKYVPAYEKGEAAYYRGNYEAAIVAFTEAISFNSKNPTIYTMRGNAYLDVGKINQAIHDYDTALEIAPNFFYALYNRGRAHSLLMHYEAALQDLEKSIELAPDDFGYRANGNIGLIYHKTGEYDQALEAFDEAISYDNSKADVFYFRGETHTAVKNYEAAIIDYLAAIERFPNYTEAYQSLGYAYYKTEQYDKAIQNLNQALGFFPNNPTAQFYLGLVYFSTDQVDDAQQAISKALETVDVLPEEEQEVLISRVIVDLEMIAEEQPNQAEQSKRLIDLIQAR